jgi:SNF2 family DNA or RNA helicase
LKLLGARAAVINGAVKQEDRDISIQAFKANRLQYLIAHPRSMGHGVTLTNCNYAIYYSLDYSHEAHSQSRDRIYRYGQRNACTYYYLLADKTIDGVILKALNAKSNVEKAVFDYIRKGKKTNSDRFVATNDKVVTEMTNFNEFIGDFEEQGFEL